MSSPTIPSVITRNQSSLNNTDWKSLMAFFQKPEGTATFITYCENKLGIKADPKPAMSIEQRKDDLTKRFEIMNKELEDLKKEEKEQKEAADKLYFQK